MTLRTNYFRCNIPFTVVISVLRISPVDGDILVGFRFCIPARFVLTIVLLRNSWVAIGKASIAAKLYFFRLSISVTETVATGVHQSKFGHAGKWKSLHVCSCVVIIVHDEKPKQTLSKIALTL